MPNTSKPKKPRINSQHEYVSLILGSRRLTTSYSGVKASGDVPRHVWQLWLDVFGGNESKPEALAKIGLAAEQKPNIGVKVQAFADHIDQIWPEWAVEAPAPAVNDTVMVDFGQADGIDTGIVVKVARNNAHVRFTRMGFLSIPFNMIRKAI